ncbi:hypothetical protein H5J22_07335 [Cetobacterium sp. 8H]|uniref:hypothetical protein n=1 Tax=Cetobacterium sp. 8H TaxID=2759681 RepID=UPI00163C7DB5|nr:hypothetical protein [Cetobacterium sp. 8H]MBC2851219.1 hypothetical protein [Cetobacterium sp. 8H]
MKKKIFLFLLFFIISIFGNLKEDIKQTKHIYISIDHEIKEKKSERDIKYINFNHSELKSISTRNNNKNTNGIDDEEFHLFNFDFTPIIKIDLEKKIIINKYLKILRIGILERYAQRVLRI